MTVGLYSGMPDEQLMTPNPGLAGIYGPPQLPPAPMPDPSTLPIHALSPMPGAYDPISGPVNERIDANAITAGNIPLDSASQRPAAFELPAQVMSASDPDAVAGAFPSPQAPPTVARAGMLSGGGGGGQLNQLRKQSEAYGQQIDQDMVDNRDAQERLYIGHAAAKAADAERLAGDAAAQAAFNENAVKEQQLRDDAYNSAADDVKRAEDEYAKMGVDSRGIFANADVGTKVMAIIGAGLSGALQVISGSQTNPFMDAIREANRDNIRAQEQNIAIKRQSVEGKRSGLQMMRQRMGDAQQAKLMEENRMLKFMHTKGEELAARSGSIEAQNRWGVLATELQQQIDANRKSIVDAKANKLIADAAAQRHAAAVADKIAFDRSLELAKLAQADRKIEAESGKSVRSELNRETSDISKRITDLKLPEAETSLKAIEAALTEDGTIAGIGPMADWKASIPVVGERVLLSDKERVGRINFNRLFDSYKHAVTGAGASNEEIANLRKSFEGARTPAEQQNVIKQARSLIERGKSNIFSGYSPEAVATYQQRMNSSTAPDMPSSVKREK